MLNKNNINKIGNLKTEQFLNNKIKIKEENNEIFRVVK